MIMRKTYTKPQIEEILIEDRVSVSMDLDIPIDAGKTDGIACEVNAFNLTAAQAAQVVASGNEVSTITQEDLVISYANS